MEVIHLGNQSRHLKCTSKSIDYATSVLAKLGIDLDPRRALLMRQHDITVVKVCAAALLHHALQDKTSVDKVGKWLDDEPEKFQELEAKTAAEFKRYYVAMGIIEDDDDDDEDEDLPPGEATSPDA